jgi:pimeloyl-ACP methyl ester carboxylesterase
MSTPIFSGRGRVWALLALVLAVLVVPSRAAAASRRDDVPAKPTIVLVHGAFADASSWNAVTERLQDRGYTVYAPANPLRGVASDAAYIRSFLATISGPIVLVGHSYGGFVITNAATGNPNVKSLVYIAAYGPDQGESIGSLGAQIPGGQLGPDTLTIRNSPGDVPEGYVDVDAFRRIFAADLPPRTAMRLAYSQRPAALSVLGEQSGAPAWKTIPSWYMVAGKDLTIGTELEKFMAKRMKAETEVVRGASHLVMISQPGAATRMILDAAGGRR